MAMQKYIVAVISFFVVLSSASAFTTSRHRWGQTRQGRFMFSTDEKESNSGTAAAPSVAQPLATMDESLGSSVTPQILTSTPVERPKMLAKNMNTGEVKEVKWVDPAMAAHTNPLQMDWWAFFLFGFPFVLLANDAFHFLPEEGPLSYLLNF